VDVRVVVCAVIERDGKVLVAQRSADKQYPRQWEVPGGKPEAGETPEQALLREVKEELACDIEVLHPIDVVRHDYGGDHHYLLLFYACRLVHGEPVVQPEQGLGKTEWAPRQRLAAYDFLEGDRAFVLRLAAKPKA
jgi:8-oxo-dGTP diphosphatase